MKNLGGGVKKRAAKETDSSSDNDSDSNASVKPRNKSRVATAGRKSGGLRGPKVAKVTKSGTGVGAAKEKKALDYGSDDFSSSSGDNLTLKATMGKHSIKGLCVCVSCLSTGKSRLVNMLRTSSPVPRTCPT